MDHTYTVYIHKNKHTEKMYIGITRQDPRQRWMYGRGYKRQQLFSRAIDKYGWDGFEHIILISGLTPSVACEFEKVLIAAFDTMNPNRGYNVKPGGADETGESWSEEARLRMSKSQTGKNHPNYGKHLSEITRKRIGDAVRGKHYGDKRPKSEETKRKMSEGKMKPVCMCEDGNLDHVIKVFRSAKDAGAELGINRKNISLCCLNKRPRAGGYSWKFA